MKHTKDNGEDLTPILGYNSKDSTERFNTFEALYKDLEISNCIANRTNHYGQSLSVGEQLDMLWHELDTTGSITKDGEWFNAIKMVKTDNPKPTQ
jgi:septation ring formation regulator EzrA